MSFGMTRRARIFTVGLISTLTVGLSAHAMTLEEAIRTAVDAHPRVQGAAAGMKAAEADVDIERATFFPTLDVRSSTGYENVNNSTTRTRGARTNGSVDPNVTTIHKEGVITAQQMLFDGLDTWSRTDAAQKRVSAAEFQLADAKEAIGLKAAQAYLEVIRAIETVRLSEENIRHHEKVSEDLKGKAASGAATSADVRQAQNRLFTAKSRTVQARGSVRDANARFIEAVGTPPDRLSDPVDLQSSVSDSADEVIQAAVAANPTLLSAKRTFESRDGDLDAARSSYLPTLSLELSGIRRQDVSGIKGPDTEATALVVMRYNLYRGGRDDARVSKALELKAQSRERESEVRRQVEQQVRTDFSAYQVVRENAPIFREKVAAASAVLDAYQQQFDLGRRSLLDLLDAEDDLYQAKVSLLNAELGTLDAQYRLLADSGALLSSLTTPPQAEMR
ncbi:hypothetical protein CU669_20210 [Paramagnetospirillum kuznetsovii]|uniref:Type I secretion protein TolC n=1 Tax=Paramagnetospirillum kuznetsovii TaxID=2053833 RepID=A0A364NT66_9PROT|nr:TolC family outer membrane protein [Paramagnetospirillum kuznetsovii]RAU20105.1 hypothetical protein CU669_20210 [Paramagnetospirillum kuznetsovii]